jgi:hypothetical protein
MQANYAKPKSMPAPRLPQMRPPVSGSQRPLVTAKPEVKLETKPEVDTELKEDMDDVKTKTNELSLKLSSLHSGFKSMESSLSAVRIDLSNVNKVTNGNVETRVCVLEETLSTVRKTIEEWSVKSGKSMAVLEDHIVSLNTQVEKMCDATKQTENLLQTLYEHSFKCKATPAVSTAVQCCCLGTFATCSVEIQPDQIIELSMPMIKHEDSVYFHMFHVDPDGNSTRLLCPVEISGVRIMRILN